MSAGTLSLTNNSAAVTGSGTTFTTELGAGDFIVVTVGGIPYTLAIKTLNSNTSLTLVSNYIGPTQAGAAWYAVPRVAMNMVTAALVAQSAEALRGLNYDKQNWQSIFSGTGNVTVTLPDGSSFTGPAWNSFTQALNGKADKVNGAVPVNQGGTGAATAEGARTNLGLNTLDGMTGGVVTGSVALKSPTTENKTEIYPGSIELSSSTPFIDFHYNNTTADYTTRISEDAAGELTIKSNGNARFGGNGGYRARAGLTGANGGNYWNFNWVSGQLRAYVDTSDLGAISFSSSDRELKENIKYCDENDIHEAFNEVMRWQPASFEFRPRGVINDQNTHLGFIANDLHSVSPQCVAGEGLPEGADIESDISSAYSLEYAALIAKLTMAIQYQQRRIEELEIKVGDAQS
ncbi:hypothetical protein BJP35_2950 [Enterobacter sp. J49]|uniref:tail fiber domain-containing protein n=1 Tax=Enterobacter sp. J49 TaxID=1903627 RepID=UPI000A3A798C|nr:tail fiber domain-containing protein [Enterobacter sp. J49]OUC36816.1 hypothetical protein BJP35_2950 [Enterobacter sp. J49]